MVYELDGEGALCRLRRGPAFAKPQAVGVNPEKGSDRCTSPERQRGDWPLAGAQGLWAVRSDSFAGSALSTCTCKNTDPAGYKTTCTRDSGCRKKRYNPYHNYRERRAVNPSRQDSDCGLARRVSHEQPLPLGLEVSWRVSFGVSCHLVNQERVGPTVTGTMSLTSTVKR
jgi:hypothetical protein